jgi:hypothetical protein
VSKKDQVDRIIAVPAPVKWFTGGRKQPPRGDETAKFHFDKGVADLITFPRIGVLGNFNAFKMDS